MRAFVEGNDSVNKAGEARAVSVRIFEAMEFSQKTLCGTMRVSVRGDQGNSARRKSGKSS
jgi:hypothetical protein